MQRNFPLQILKVVPKGTDDQQAKKLLLSHPYNPHFKITKMAKLYCFDNFKSLVSQQIVDKYELRF